MTLLSIVQQAFGEVGFAPPSTVVGNSDAQVIRALYLANRAGIELRDIPKAADYWPVLRKQFLFNLNGIGPFTGTFTPGSNVITNITGTNLAGVQAGWQVSSKFTVNDTMVTSVGANSVTMTQNAALTATQGAQTDTNVAFGQEAYPLPSDFGYFIPQTGWDRNFRWQLLGPVDAQEWQVLKSGISPVGPRLRYRIMGSGQSTATGQGSVVASQSFTTTTQTGPYVLNSAPISVLLVALDGAVLVPNVDYTLSGSTITLTNAPLSGQGLYVVWVSGTQAGTNIVGMGPLQIFINPAPYVPSNTQTPVNDLIVMEYASANWVAVGGAPTAAVQQSFSLDTDVSVIPEDLITLSLKWRLLKAVGMAWADEWTEYDDKVCAITGRQTMARNLPLNARASGIRLLNSQNVPDTGFGS